MIPYTLIAAIPILPIVIYKYEEYYNIYCSYKKYSRDYQQIIVINGAISAAMQGARKDEYLNKALSACPNEAPKLVKLLHDSIIDFDDFFTYYNHVEGLTPYHYIPLILFPISILDIYRFKTKNEDKQEIQNGKNQAVSGQFILINSKFYIEEAYNLALKTSYGIKEYLSKEYMLMSNRIYNTGKHTLNKINENIYKPKIEINYMKNPNLDAIKKTYCYGVGTAGNIAKISTYGFSFYSVSLLHNKALSTLVPNVVYKSALNILKQVPGSNYVPPIDNLIDLINKSAANFLPDIFHLQKGIPGAFGIAISSYYFVSNSEDVYKNSVTLAKATEILVEDILSLGLCKAPAGLFDGLF